MILYKGSKLNMNPFEPQPVHPDDYDKFKGLVPEKVIFATESKTKAKIFATFSNVISFGSTTNRSNSGITVYIEEPLPEETLEKNVYIYSFDSNNNTWHYIDETKEWYTTQPQTPIEIEKYSRGELYNELKKNPEVSFTTEKQEWDNSTIS